MPNMKLVFHIFSLMKSTKLTLPLDIKVETMLK